MKHSLHLFPQKRTRSTLLYSRKAALKKIKQFKLKCRACLKVWTSTCGPRLGNCALSVHWSCTTAAPINWTIDGAIHHVSVDCACQVQKQNFFDYLSSSNKTRKCWICLPKPNKHLSFLSSHTQNHRGMSLHNFGVPGMQRRNLQNTSLSECHHWPSQQRCKLILPGTTLSIYLCVCEIQPAYSFRSESKTNINTGRSPGRFLVWRGPLLTTNKSIRNWIVSLNFTQAIQLWYPTLKFASDMFWNWRDFIAEQFGSDVPRLSISLSTELCQFTELGETVNGHTKLQFAADVSYHSDYFQKMRWNTLAQKNVLFWISGFGKYHRRSHLNLWCLFLSWVIVEKWLASENYFLDSQASISFFLFFFEEKFVANSPFLDYKFRSNLWQASLHESDNHHNECGPTSQDSGSHDAPNPSQRQQPISSR